MSKNSNYLVGYRAERKAKQILENEEYYVIRAAGSHGMFDLAAFSKKNVRLIQLKVIPHGEKRVFQREREKIKKASFCPNVKKELWVYEKRLGWHHYYC